MDLVVAVAFGVLALIFVGSVLALIIVCKQRRQRHFDDNKPILRFSRDNLPHWNGVDAELDDVLQLSPNIAKILRDNEWAFDGSVGGIMENCLTILRLCHQVTDKLSGLLLATNSAAPIPQNQDMMDRACHAVMPRVDDLVRSMYASTRKGVVHAPLLEARSAALVMACSALVVAFRALYARRISGVDVQWLTSVLMDMDLHLDAIRLVAQQEELLSAERVEVVLEPTIEADEGADDGPCSSKDMDSDGGPSTSTAVAAAASQDTPLLTPSAVVATSADMEECPADPHVVSAPTVGDPYGSYSVKEPSKVPESATNGLDSGGALKSDRPLLNPGGITQVW